MLARFTLQMSRVLVALGVLLHACAACAGPCGCEVQGQTFCNFAGGNSGGCESCTSFIAKGNPASCDDDGLPSKGAADCKTRCFISGTHASTPPPPVPIVRMPIARV